MTFNKYILECEMFQYSKEKFDFTEECSELELRRRYIESQRFLLANKDMILLERAPSFQGEGYLIKSMTAPELEAFEENYNDKLKDWLEKALKKMTEILGKLIPFFKSLLRKYLDLDKAANKVIEKLNTTKLTRADNDEIIKIVNDAIERTGAPISNKQPGGSRGLPNSITIGEPSIRNKLAAALVSNRIHVTVNSDKFKMALNERQLQQFFDEVSKVLAGTGDESYGSLPDEFIDENLKRGIFITNGSASINNLIEALEKSKQLLLEKNRENTVKDIRAGVNNKLYSDAMSIAGHSLALYSSINKFKFYVIGGIARILNEKQQAAGTDAATGA